MSEWDEHDPIKKRQKLLADPAAAERLIAADRALIAACRKSPIDLDALHAALKNEASPDRLVFNGFPALHIALHQRDVRAMDMLLRFGARPDDVNGEFFNALDEAHRLQFPDGIKLLKRYGAELHQLRDEYDQRHDSVAPSYQSRADAHMFNMLKTGTAQQLRQALELGADANALENFKAPAYTPVQTAAAWVDVEKVKILLEYGADVTKRSSHGLDIIDVMWTAGTKALSAPWVEIFDCAVAHGYTNMYQRHPSEMIFDDLMEPVQTSSKEKPTRLHYLVAHGQVEKVFEILERSSGRKLGAAELLRQEPYYRNETLLKAISSQNQLSRIFTAAVWHGRVEEMMSLQPAVERDVQMKKQVDFDKARAEVMGQRLRDMKSRAVNLKLK